MVAQFRTSPEDTSRFETIYRTVLNAYEELGYPAAIVNSWAIGPHDAPDLMAVAQRAKPEKILEVGTYVGVSTMLMALACPRAQIFTVDPDLPLEIEMGATRSSVANVDSTATTHAIARAAAEKLGIADRITFVKGGFSVRETFSSTLTSRGTKVKLAGPKLCKDEGPFDFIFIDGLHSSEAVASDLRLSAKHLAPSGVMALHDCIGFWGANVRAGVMEFIRSNPSYRFIHPPYADLWRSIGLVAKAGSKAIDRAQFAAPMPTKARSVALCETFATMVVTSFGARDVLEVSVGAPLLKDAATHGRYVCVRALGGRGGQNLNAELDRILTQFDKLDAPVLFSADLLDFSPPKLTQNLLAAVAFRKGTLLLGVTPPGEAGVAGPESRPAAWLVDIAREIRFAAYAPPLLDLEPARYGLLPEMRELGRNSQLASALILAPRGGFVDAKRRKLVELTPELAAEREQAELQRVHLASGYRRFFNESNTKSDLLAEQSRQLHEQIQTAQEAAQREKLWREENSQSLGAQVSRLTQQYQAIEARVAEANAEIADRDTTIADLMSKLSEAAHDDEQARSRLNALTAESRNREATISELSKQLDVALRSAQQEKGWRTEAAASHLAQIAELTEHYRGALVREAALRAQNETSLEMARLESGLRDEKEARLRGAIEDLAAAARERDAALAQAASAKSALERELARVEEERRAAVVREASVINQLQSTEEVMRFELEARSERERRLWKNLQEMSEAERREASARAAIELMYQERLRAADDGVSQALSASNALREALAVEQQARTHLDATINDLRKELAQERALRAEVEARAQLVGEKIAELSDRLTTIASGAQDVDSSSSEEMIHLAQRLDKIKVASDDYLVRLVDVYNAIDSFDSQVTAGEASLSKFERNVLGMMLVETDAAVDPWTDCDSLDAISTTAQLRRLKDRWGSLFSRLGRSVDAGAARVRDLEQQTQAARTKLAEAQASFEQAMMRERDLGQQRLEQADADARKHLAALETDTSLRLAEFDAVFRQQHAELLESSARTQQLFESQAFLEGQLAELKGVLEARTLEGRDVSARLSVLAAQNADLTQHLIDAYQALDEIDTAVIDQLRICNQMEAQLPGEASSDVVFEPGDDTQDYLVLLRQRARALPSKIARLLSDSESRYHAAEETSRNLQSHASALEQQIAGIRRSTSWRALAPARAAGTRVRALRRRVGAILRGRKLLKLKAELDGRLKPLGLEVSVFDAHGYAKRYGDVPAALALRHYLSFGENEGRLPIAKFDPAFYYRMYPDVQTSRVSALLHFLRFGVNEGRSPCGALHPLGSLAAAHGMSPLEFFARS